eukprot:7427133-Pyramimonas_sp.AAC.1
MGCAARSRSRTAASGTSCRRKTPRGRPASRDTHIASSVSFRAPTLDAVESTVETLVRRRITREFDSPGDSSLTSNVRVEPYRHP